MLCSAPFAVIFRSPFYSICHVNRSSQNSRDMVLARGKYSVHCSHITKTLPGGQRMECQWPAQAFTTFNLKGSIYRTNHRLYTSCTQQQSKGLKNIHLGKQKTDGFPLPFLKLMLCSLSFVLKPALTPPPTTTTFSFNIIYGS